MKKADSKTNKLYLVCPICRMEPFIARNFGDGYFYTAPASVFQLDPATVKALKETITKNSISELVWVGNSDCCFIHNVLDKTASGLNCENTICSLHAEGDTEVSLIQKLMKDQIARLKNTKVFGKEIARGELRLTSIIASKHSREVIPA